MLGKEKVLVLGGGITGLNLSYQLLKRNPKLNLQLIEKSSRVGGWLNTVQHRNNKLEVGPRSIRPSGLAGLYTLNLVNDLNLTHELLPIQKTSKLAKTRYIYYDDKLVKLPNSIADLLSSKEPLLNGIVKNIVKETFSLFNTNKFKNDMSIGDFFRLRLGSQLTQNLLSAVVHGIYAGDLDKLSIKSTFKSIYLMQRKYRSLGLGTLLSSLESKSTEQIILENKLKSNNYLYEVYKNCIMYSFQSGIATLSQQLLKELKTFPNFNLIDNFDINELQINLDSCKVTDTQTNTIQGTKVISCLGHNQLLNIFEPLKQDVTTNFKMESVDVITINLGFNKKLNRPLGFGYLIPKNYQTVNNQDDRYVVDGIDVKDLVLGVVFDYDTFPELYPNFKDSLTLMVGGHHFTNCKQLLNKDDSFWTKVAQLILHQHLKVTDQPIFCQINRNFNCIPQFTVGHLDRVKQVHQFVQKFEGKLKICSSSYSGVAINDCITYSTKFVDNFENQGSGLEPYLSEFK